jgi:hypothetical protein
MRDLSSCPSRGAVRLGGALLATLVVSSAATLASASPRPEGAPPSGGGAPPVSSDCSVKPLPTGCIRAITYIDPASVRFTATPDALRVDWSINGPGATEQLPSPLPLGQARRRAAAKAVARGDAFGTSGGPRVRVVRSHRVRSAQSYGGACTGYAYRPSLVSLGGNKYHGHAQSTQTCFGVSLHSVQTWLYIGPTPRRGDTEYGFNAEAINTNAWDTCYYSSSPHTFWNWSDFTAEATDGRLIQGPEGYYLPIDHHCL